MPQPYLQQRQASAASVRVRVTNKLLRELGRAPALTPDQRARILNAAASIALVER